MTMRSLSLCAAALVLGPLAAQTPEPAATSLSLAQAIRRALAQNPRVQQSLLHLAESSEDRRAAASSLMPSIAAEAYGQRSRANLDTFIGTPTPPPHGPGMVGPYNWGTVGLEAQLSVLDLGLWKKWKASRHAEEAARAGTRAVREDVTALVVGQYLAALRDKAAVASGRSRVELAEALAQLAENQQKQGVGTKLDTLRAQVMVQTERQRLIRAETRQRAAQAGLVRLLDLPPSTRLELTESLGAPEVPKAGFDQAYQAGLSQRPELAALEAREKAAGELHRAARDLRLPTVVATGTLGSTGLQSEPWPQTYQVSLGVRLPLFTGGLVSSRIARAKVEQQQVQEAQRELKAQVGLEVRVAQDELEAAAHEVEVANQSVALSTEALAQARHRFEAGVSNNIEVINAQDDLARANENQISALYRLNQSRADLARATGQLETFFTR